MTIFSTYIFVNKICYGLELKLLLKTKIIKCQINILCGLKCLSQLNISMLRQIYVAITKLSLRFVGDSFEWHLQKSLLFYFYLFSDVLVNI